MQQLLSSNTYLEQHIDFEDSPQSLILKTIAPQKQALNQGELLQLVKNDQLEADAHQNLSTADISEAKNL